MPTVKWNKRWADDLARTIKNDRIPGMYGTQWGDPDVSGLRYWIRRITRRSKSPGNLSEVIQYYITPFVTSNSIVLEIGPGGGRWTKYLLNAKEIILADLNAEFFPYLSDRFQTHSSILRFHHTSGYELDGIESDYVDFVFPFGTFVHIDPDDILRYLGSIERVLKPNGIAAIQYSDKTKKAAQMNRGFSDMNPSRMESFISNYAFKLVDHNTGLLNHSSIILIQKSHLQ